MQHQQQVGGGGPPPFSSYGGGAAAEMVISDEDPKLGDLGIAEAASPISSRPPAPGNPNFEEMIQATAEAGGSSGNRWPRQETLALLQIRSEMDAAFRDATLKGPLWEQVSRKLAELGYHRNAKKCKEKFENVHKYYKRTKEGRGGRQDGKSYKFFSQLEALNHNIATGGQALPRITPAAVSLPPPPAVVSLPPPDQATPAAAAAGTSARDAPQVPLFGNLRVSFSSDSSDDEDDEDVEMEMEATENRKRKRGDDHSDGRMMEFFEGLLKQVMQKQEEMQQKFLEAIEKREQDRMIREEAWKRQDMARISREHDLMAQERAISTSRDAAIIAFLEKITGQTIHLPTAVPQNPPPPPPTVTPAPRPPPPSHRQPTSPQQQPTDQRKESQSREIVVANQVTNIVAVTPEQHIQQQDRTAEGSFEMNSSRWPKAEVLALIHLRSGMEPKYQEAVPKGPLWEEISAGMQRMGYNRNAKRCKEKWENINKYFKKVKESNKKRPEDAKTCPYFHELDALYRKKILGSTSGGAPGGLSGPPQQDVGQTLQSFPANVSVDKDGGTSEVQTTGVGAISSTPFGEEKQPEDMLKKQLLGEERQDDKCSNSIECSDEEDCNYELEDGENEEYDDKTEEEMKMVYKIQFQRPNNVRSSSTTGGGTPPSSFVAMVQ